MKLKFMHYIRTKLRWHWYVDGSDYEWNKSVKDDTEATVEWLKEFLNRPKEQHGRDDSNI